MPSGCVCDDAAGLFPSLDGSTCLPCASAIANCHSCSSNGSATFCSISDDGFYITGNSQVCAPCAGYCLTCTVNGTACSSCLPTFSLISNLTCGCDNANSFFYNPSTQGCSLCSNLIPNCIVCVTVGNSTECSVPANQFYWDSLTASCLSCPPTCGNCSSALVCTSCSDTFALSEMVAGWTAVGQCICDNSTATAPYYDPASGTCQACDYFFPSCSACIANGTTALCNSCAGGTYLIDGSCMNCPSSCDNCSSDSICTSCPGNLTLSGGVCICDSYCSQCEELSTGCVSCNIVAGIIADCFACESGNYLASPNCLSCPSTCATCTSSTTCLTCKLSYILVGGLCICATDIGIFPNVADVCAPCSSIYYGCTECSNDSG
jgi:proprotein convertase subtilisin/kexin type 5